MCEFLREKSGECRDAHQRIQRHHEKLVTRLCLDRLQHREARLAHHRRQHDAVETAEQELELGAVAIRLEAVGVELVHSCCLPLALLSVLEGPSCCCEGPALVSSSDEFAVAACVVAEEPPLLNRHL